MASVVLNDKENSTVGLPQTTNPDATNKDNSTNNNICRILVDQSFEKSIVLDELSIELIENEKGSDEKSNKAPSGREYPIIRIKEYIVRPEEIKSMTISLNDRIPSLSLSITTQNVSYRSINMPTDGDIVSIFMAPKTDTLMGIRADFVIESVSTSTSQKGLSMTVGGKMFIPGFEADTMYGIVGTSKDAFMESARKFGLGFATDDLDDTTDKQMWICPNISAVDFLNNTISHTWKDGTSFFDWWIDPYYNINFINVNKIILQNTQELDITASQVNVGASFEMGGDAYKQENTVAIPKLFTNIPEVSKGIFFVTKWTVYNNSTEITFEDGVEIITNEFMHNENLYGANQDEDKNILKLSNIPAYDQSKLDDFIILRGRPEYDPSKNPKGQQAKANYNYNEIYIKHPWSGISYVLSDDNDNDQTNTWDGNVNKNYTRAPYHNKINLDELNKLYITITVNGLCTEVMRGEVVPIVLRKTILDEAGVGGTEAQGKADTFYNGYYYVSDMIYNFKSGNPMKFTTTLTLKRREWPIPVDYKKEKTE